MQSSEVWSGFCINTVIFDFGRRISKGDSTEIYRVMNDAKELNGEF